MAKRLLIPLSIIVLIAFTLYTGWIVQNGLNKITFLYTFISLSTIFIVLAFLIRAIAGSWKNNAMLALAATVIVLFIIESVLRFGVRTKQVYTEKNGSPYYASFYEGKRSSVDKDDGPNSTERLRIYPANSERVLSRKEYNYVHTYNNYGIRGEDISETKPEGVQRIIALGDSFTEGEGSPQDSTWVNLLELNLEASYENVEIECINAGTGGSDPVQAYYMLEHLVHLNPDFVLLAINSTEIGELITRGGFERYDEGSDMVRKGPWWEAIYATSFICRHIVHDFLKYDNYLIDPDRFEEEMNIALETILRAFSSIEALAKANNFSFAVSLHPHNHEMYSRLTAYGAFSNYARSLYQFPIINIEGCFDSKIQEAGSAPIDYYWPIDHHHNSRGYQMFADCITEMLEFGF